MPRFEDTHVTVLKSAMLARLPTCLFTEEDVTKLVNETGLDRAQVLHWAEHMRARNKPEDREAFLRLDGTAEKVT